MRPIIINSNNLVENGFNNTYQYNFPTGSVTFKDDQIAIAQISIYYSWFNISSQTTGAQYNNNVFQYIWYDAGGAATYTVTLPDGFYEISDINAYLQYVFVTNGHYLVDGAGDFVYYMELKVNQTYYGVQLNSYPIPTGLPAGWTNPAGMTFPAVASTPQLIVLSTNNFADVIGFTAGTYPTVTQATNYSVLSSYTPQVTPINSIILTCSLLNNKYSLPSTLLFTFAPRNATFGELVDITIPQYTFTDIQDGDYNSLTIEFLDQNLRKVFIRDSNLVVTMVIASKQTFVLK